MPAKKTSEFNDSVKNHKKLNAVVSSSPTRDATIKKTRNTFFRRYKTYLIPYMPNRTVSRYFLDIVDFSANL